MMGHWLTIVILGSARDLFRADESISIACEAVNRISQFCIDYHDHDTSAGRICFDSLTKLTNEERLEERNKNSTILVSESLMTSPRT